MKKLLIFLAVGLMLIHMSQIQAQATPLIRQVAVLYDARFYDPVSYPNTDAISGPGVLVMLGSMPGINETNVDWVKFIHTRPDGVQDVYNLGNPRCLEDYPPFGIERVWFVFIKYWMHALGNWKFKIKHTDGTIESRALNVNTFSGFPGKPSNVQWWDNGDGSVHLEWDATAGPPDWFDSKFHATYRVCAEGDATGPSNCSTKECLYVVDPNYDPNRGRVWLDIPGYWRGLRLRIENRLHRAGGLYKLWNDEGEVSTGQLSRAIFHLIIP